MTRAWQYPVRTELNLSLFTHQGRLNVTLKIGKFQSNYLQIGIPKEAELIRKNNKWYFNLVLDIPEVSQKQGNKVLGVDVGEL